ncbi:circularly permuted type 2 ATP-grasp protein [Ideonella oryzae]|uniref:Circularly permuted type 2 ATP-grasp protein n=1 Tax=Ideonella oryzae TaxID=2937441 RepID=A0ABT1BJQ9_9BURK|nr:circularly permuted type 2 ATP-grasp protein [Ideonella oryzae]MCO5976109.1 circularly permuted type 2 ATP-grasp protein [Ideonella oryzae]
MSSGVPAIVPMPPQQTSLLSDEPLDPVALAHGALQRGDEGHFDELTGRLNEGAAPAGALTPTWQRFFESTGAEGWQDLPNRQDRLRHRVREDGATYNVYDDPDQPTRPWPLELLPMLIGADDWADIEQGVAQRARLLNAAMADIYGERSLLDLGLLPTSLVLGHPQYLRPLHGAKPLGGVHLHVAAFDLSRGPDGSWRVLQQRTQAPSGLGYLVENRLIVSQQLPEAFRDLHVQRLAASFQTLMEGLMRISPAGETSRAALLTPGPRNETYFEHVFLARYLGITLVEGGDLTVRANRLYLKTLRGLERVHILLRRVDDEYLDPLELRPDSALGIPGLVQALRAGEVVVANAPGAGWLESPGLAAFWPGVSRHLLGEELLLPSATSWWCGEQTVWDTHKGRLEEFVVAPTFPASDTTHSFAPVLAATQAPSARASLAGRIEADPAAHTLQSRSRPSEMPVWHDGRLEPRPAVIRVFAISDGQGGWQVLPGGMTRVATRRDALHDPWLSMQRGSASADTWVLTDGPVDPTTLLPKPLSAADLSQMHRSVTSRSAENLFWLGRYTERAENSVRLARLTLESLSGAALHEATPAVFTVLDQLARRHGLVGDSVPSPLQSQRVFERSLVHALGDTRGATSVSFNLQALLGCAQALRERLSTEHWQLIREVGEQFQDRLSAIFESASIDPITEVIGALTQADGHLAAITGGQTDRMTRDDGWRLLSVGRQLERLDFLSHAMACSFEHGLHRCDDGFALMLGFFDSTITYRAHFQARREVPPLLHLLVFDTDNPRSLAWVGRTMRERLLKLARHEPAWAQEVVEKLPRPEQWSLEALSADRGDHAHPALVEALQSCSVQAQAVSDAIGRKLFSHVGPVERMVWQ